MVRDKISEKQIWIVMPAFNEAKYLARVISKVKKYFPRLIVVDDGSTDQTAQVAQKLNSHVLIHRTNLGKGAALRTGCQYAFEVLKARAVIFMDSDDQHDPAEIKLFVQQLLAGQSIIFGERKMWSDMPLLRIIFNRLASVIILCLFGRYIPDIPSGFKALTQKSYQSLNLQASGYEIELEIAAKVAKQKLPFEVVQISTIYYDYNRGMTLLNTLSMLWHLMSWRIGL